MSEHSETNQPNLELQNSLNLIAGTLTTLQASIEEVKSNQEELKAELKSDIQHLVNRMNVLEENAITNEDLIFNNTNNTTSDYFRTAKPDNKSNGSNGTLGVEELDGEIENDQQQNEEADDNTQSNNIRQINNEDDEIITPMNLYQKLENTPRNVDKEVTTLSNSKVSANGSGTCNIEFVIDESDGNFTQDLPLAKLRKEKVATGLLMKIDQGKVTCVVNNDKTTHNISHSKPEDFIFVKFDSVFKVPPITFTNFEYFRQPWKGPDDKLTLLLHDEENKYITLTVSGYGKNPAIVTVEAAEDIDEEAATIEEDQEEQHDYVDDQYQPFQPPRTVHRNSAASQISQISQGNMSITQKIPGLAGSIPTNNVTDLVTTFNNSKLIQMWQEKCKRHRSDPPNYNIEKDRQPTTIQSVSEGNVNKLLKTYAVYVMAGGHQPLNQFITSNASTTSTFPAVENQILVAFQHDFMEQYLLQQNKQIPQDLHDIDNDTMVVILLHITDQLSPSSWYRKLSEVISPIRNTDPTVTTYKKLLTIYRFFNNLAILMRENPQSVDEAKTIHEIRNHLKKYSHEIYSKIIYEATKNVTSIHTYAMSSLMKLDEVKTRIPDEIRDSIEPKLRMLTVALGLLREHHLQLKTTTPSTSTSNYNNLSKTSTVTKNNYPKTKKGFQTKKDNNLANRYNSNNSVSNFNRSRTLRVDSNHIEEQAVTEPPPSLSTPQPEDAQDQEHIAQEGEVCDNDQDQISIATSDQDSLDSSTSADLGEYGA